MQVTFRLTHFGTWLDMDSWQPGYAYVLHVDVATDEDSAVPASVYAWAHASIGQMSANDLISDNDVPCTNAYYSDTSSTSQSFVWTAPEEGTDECAIISAAVATGPSSAYQTNKVRSILIYLC